MVNEYVEGLPLEEGRKYGSGLDISAADIGVVELGRILGQIAPFDTLHV